MLDKEEQVLPSTKDLALDAKAKLIEDIAFFYRGFSNKWQGKVDRGYNFV